MGLGVTRSDCRRNGTVQWCHVPYRWNKALKLTDIDSSMLVKEMSDIDTNIDSDPPSQVQRLSPSMVPYRHFPGSESPAHTSATGSSIFFEAKGRELLEEKLSLGSGMENSDAPRWRIDRGKGWDEGLG